MAKCSETIDNRRGGITMYPAPIGAFPNGVFECRASVAKCRATLCRWAGLNRR
jgi:hypothetical protein